MMMWLWLRVTNPATAGSECWQSAMDSVEPERRELTEGNRGDSPEGFSPNRLQVVKGVN